MNQAADLRSLLRQRIRKAAEAAGWGAEAPEVAAIVLELPREFAHGDLASPIAFALAKALKRPPRDVATALAEKIGHDAVVDRVEVAGGGYLNFFLGEEIWRGVLASIETAGPKYGGGAALAHQKFLVEFVSANPTGPLVVANARYAAFGEALCRVLEASGATVEREYYINDAGQQVLNLALSLEARWKQAQGQAAELPKDGYHGDYIIELMKQVYADNPGIPKLPEDRRLVELAKAGTDAMIDQQRQVMSRLRVEFTRWFHERDLHTGGEVDAAFDRLKAKDMVFLHEGAWWFKAKQFGDEKDRVVRRSDGAPAYLLPDIAYHLNKFARGYDHVIDIVGADHQVEMATLRQALGALGIDTDKLEIIITQFINLKRGVEKVIMSKRSGNVIMLDELVDEVGVDAARFFFLTRAPGSSMDFDLELAKSTTLDNPVYYLQYAHARLCSVIARAKEEGIPGPSAAQGDPAQLAEPETRMVLRKLARFPLVVEKAALGRAPHLLTHELLELAQAVHQFYTHNRVVGAESAPAAEARLALVGAARQTLANGMELLGVSAPERM